MKQHSAFSIQHSAKRGFTLVELLVVITIIGLLTTIGMVVYQGSVRRGRDSRRQADLAQVRIMLDLYRNDNPAYPDAGSWDELETALTGYTEELPVDPKGYAYFYVRDADTYGYELCAHLETAADTDSYCGISNKCGGSCNYRVRNP